MIINLSKTNKKTWASCFAFSFLSHRMLNVKGLNHCSRKHYYFIGGKNCPPSFPVPYSLFSGSRSFTSLSVPGFSFPFPDGILLVSCVTALLFSASVFIGLNLLLLAWVSANVASAPIGCNLSRVRALLLAQLPSAGALLGSNKAVAPIPLVEVSTSWYMSEVPWCWDLKRDVPPCFGFPINNAETINKLTTP